MHSPPFAENCQHRERNSPENSGPVHECRCVCLKSDSLNNHEDGELCLKLTQMRRAWREPDLKENLCFERNYNLKNLLNLLNQSSPSLYDYGTVHFSGTSMDASQNTPQNTVWEMMSQVITSRLSSVFPRPTHMWEQKLNETEEWFLKINFLLQWCFSLENIYRASTMY